MKAFHSIRFAAAPTTYKITDRIKVQDGGFDYATFDAANQRVLMARPIHAPVLLSGTGSLPPTTTDALSALAPMFTDTAVLLISSELPELIGAGLLQRAAR